MRGLRVELDSGMGSMSEVNETMVCELCVELEPEVVSNLGESDEGLASGDREPTTKDPELSGGVYQGLESESGGG